MRSALQRGVNCGTFAPNTACCILGFHDSSGQQTIGTADFDTSDKLLSPVPDVSDMSHEVAEWMNDPFGNNPTPLWGQIGQVTATRNLEAGDPERHAGAADLQSENGFTYHMQELHSSWFYGRWVSTMSPPTTARLRTTPDRLA